MTGKNSITGNLKYKMPGRIAIGMPYKSIGDQLASDAWNSNQTEIDTQLFVNSTIEETLKSFKSSDKERIKLNYKKTLKGADIPKDDNVTIHTTYNQILNISHEDMATFDYVVIDESHTFSDGLNYRSDVIAKLINYLIEFVAKKRKAKTKIIFMTGTPNVEALVIPELMEEQSLGELFQIIKVDKKYKKTPKMYLTHLDTTDTKIRKDTTIAEIKKYYKQGRKVVQIFNNKENIDKYGRELQAKISSDLKVGLFYSGSTGACTENILAGKFGEYDVVLTTTYFMNGINIYLDNITKEEHSKGGVSSQKYAVVVDLGSQHTKVSAMDVIQTINRFRNRLCNATVLLPKIFKPDVKNASRKFHFGNTNRVLLGINRYNYHLLSTNKNKEAKVIDEVTQKQNIHYLEEVRKSPSKVTKKMIEKAMQQSKNENAVINSINKKTSIYEDWFYSVDGYHYLAEDAGILPIIKHMYVSEPLEDISNKHLSLENSVIKNFLDNENALIYLEGQLDPDKRIFVKSSGVITDPLSDQVSNFTAEDLKNETYQIKGDFHVSHERAINKLIRYHLKLSYWYGTEKAIEILRLLINDTADYVPFKAPSYLKSIANYVNSYSYLTKDKYLKEINYLRALDYLSQKNIGIIKEVFPTKISFTFINDNVASQLKEMWAKQQFEKTIHGIENANDVGLICSKEELKEAFSDEELMKESDLENLEDLLDKLTIYRPMKKDKNGNVRSHERIIIPRILRSKRLFSGLEFLESETVAPVYSDVNDSNIEFKNFTTKMLKRLDDHLTQVLILEHTHIETIYHSLKVKLKKRDIQGAIEYIEGILNDTKKNKLPEVNNTLCALKTDLKEIDRFLLSAFKTAEHLTYQNINHHKTMPFIEQTFFCDEDFKLESLKVKPGLNKTNFDVTDIYDSLCMHSDKYIKKDKIKIRTENGRKIIDFNSSLPSKFTTNVHVISDVNDNILYANFDQLATCEFLCEYAFENERFKMIDGSIPVKTANKGIYNPKTFKKNYFVGSSESKTLSNYTITTYVINIKEYGTYVRS